MGAMVRILLAEDDESMRVYLARALERSGYEVVAVATGTEAVPHIRSDRFDLLLTDIVMPEMDGIELARRATELDPDLKVKGTESLRVVDASAMPDLVSAHTNACALMIGEKGSDMIRGHDPLPAANV